MRVRRGSDRWARAEAMFAAAVAVALWTAGCSSGPKAARNAVPPTTAPRVAPSGAAFYTPPSPLPAGKPGDVIWSRPLTGSHVLPDAAANTLVLFHSAAVRDGRDIAESAMLAIPRGNPPSGGWPVIAYAHGTAGGVADQCVTSADDSPTFPMHAYTTTIDRSLDQWVKAGYVVVQPDYEGFGPPDPNPYAIGESQARSMVDSVRAARVLNSRIGDRWIAMGHSLGGQASLFTAKVARTRAPELELAGAISLAPLSGLAQLVAALASNPKARVLDGNFGLEVFGAATAYPNVEPEAILSSGALALYRQVDSKCAPDLRTLWLGKTSRDILRPGADVGPLLAALRLNDPSVLHLTIPVYVAQGTADTSVSPSATAALVRSLCANGAPLVYKTYKGADHWGVVAASLVDAEQWVRARLAAQPAPTNC